MKNMTLTLIDKKYTVEMDSHEYIKYLAYKLGIPVSNNKEPQTLRQYYADFVEIFSVRLSSNSKVMTVKEIQEYAEALYTISMMFDLGKTEELTPIPVDLTKKTDSCTYIPELDIYVKDYGTGIDLDYKRLWYTNEFDTLMEVSMDDYTIISETIETSKLPRAGTKGVEICH